MSDNRKVSMTSFSHTDSTASNSDSVNKLKESLNKVNLYESSDTNPVKSLDNKKLEGSVSTIRPVIEDDLILENPKTALLPSKERNENMPTETKETEVTQTEIVVKEKKPEPMAQTSEVKVQQNLECRPVKQKEVQGVQGVDDGEKEPPIKPKNKSKNRCGICRKKLNLVTASTGKCRCEGVFCGNHRMPEAHECTFDHRAIWQKELEKRNPKVVAPKLTRF